MQNYHPILRIIQNLTLDVS